MLIQPGGPWGQRGLPPHSSFKLIQGGLVYVLCMQVCRCWSTCMFLCVCRVGALYWVCLLSCVGYSLHFLVSCPSSVPGPCEILSMTPCSGHPFPLPRPPPLLLCSTGEMRRLGWAHGSPGSPGPRQVGHTHPWMQWAAVTTQLKSMRAPPHTCSFSSRRLTSQGQWRVMSKSSDHQGFPQASGTSM